MGERPEGDGRFGISDFRFGGRSGCWHGRRGRGHHDRREGFRAGDGEEVGVPRETPVGVRLAGGPAEEVGAEFASLVGRAVREVGEGGIGDFGEDGSEGWEGTMGFIFRRGFVRSPRGEGETRVALRGGVRRCGTESLFRRRRGREDFGGVAAGGDAFYGVDLVFGEEGVEAFHVGGWKAGVME